MRDFYVYTRNRIGIPVHKSTTRESLACQCQRKLLGKVWKTVEQRKCIDRRRNNLLSDFDHNPKLQKRTSKTGFSHQECKFLANCCTSHSLSLEPLQALAQCKSVYANALLQQTASIANIANIAHTICLKQQHQRQEHTCLMSFLVCHFVSHVLHW